MAFIQYNFKEENKRTYKGINYWKFDEEYIIIPPNNWHVIRYTLKDVKSYINEYLKGN